MTCPLEGEQCNSSLSVKGDFKDVVCFFKPGVVALHGGGFQVGREKGNSGLVIITQGLDLQKGSQPAEHTEPL